ncbi:DUF3418 domain-containing protein [Myxococcota bacterium]
MELLADTELGQLAQIPRYLRAAQASLARAILDPRKDASKAESFIPVWTAFLRKHRSAQDRHEASKLAVGTRRAPRVYLRA